MYEVTLLLSQSCPCKHIHSYITKNPIYFLALLKCMPKRNAIGLPPTCLNLLAKQVHHQKLAGNMFMMSSLREGVTGLIHLFAALLILPYMYASYIVSVLSRYRFTVFHDDSIIYCDL